MSGGNKFRVIYPGTSKLLFDGGMNSKFEKSLIEDNESPDCLNVTFGAGSVGSREGFVTVNTATVGAFVCDGLYTRRGTGNAETMVAFFNGTGYTLNGTSFITIGSAQSVFTGGVRVACAQMSNQAFFCTGNSVPYKWTGADWTQHGLTAPAMTASFASNGAGNPNGDYLYKITYLNSGLVEGNVSPASTTFTVASKIIRLTSLPVAPQSFGVAARRIYRTVAGNTTTFLRVATINDNTTTLYDDNIADGSLGAAAPTNNGGPPNYSTIVYHQNRLFMNDTSNPGLLWYSELSNPYTVKTGSFIAIGDQSTDFITALGVFSNTLAVFCQRSVWLIYMPSTDPTTWQVIKSKSPYTTKSPFGLFEYDNMLAFPAVQNDKFLGIAALSGDGLAADSTLLTINTVGSEFKSSRIEPDMFDIQESFLGNISSIVFKNVAYMSMTKGANNTTNNRIYIMDFSHVDLSKHHKEAWSPWSGLNAAQFTVYSGKLYFASSTNNGTVYKQNSGVSADDSTAINAYFWTKEFPGFKGEESFDKDFRWANLLVDLAGAYTMDVGVRTNSDSGSGSNYQISVDPHASLWGSLVWGSGTWGAGSLQNDPRLFLEGAKGKRIQFKFSNQNTVNQRFKVHWMNFTYNLKGPR